MYSTNESDDWRVLCELASKEKDPEKLVNLVMKINQALEECNLGSHNYRRELNIETVVPAKDSARPDVNVDSHGITCQRFVRRRYDC